MANVAITGAGRGIGLELVKQYAQNGDRVYALCRSPEKAAELNALVAGSGGMVTVHAMDVGDDASVKAAAASTGEGQRRVRPFLTRDECEDGKGGAIPSRLPCLGAFFPDIAAPIAARSNREQRSAARLLGRGSPGLRRFGQ